MAWPSGVLCAARRLGRPRGTPRGRRRALPPSRSLVWVAAAAGLFGAAQAGGHGLHLEYQAFIAGTKAGAAHIHLRLEAGGYQVRGTLATDGLWGRLSPWRARFAVEGGLRGGQARPVALGVQEWARRKERTIHVANGVLRQLRNGRHRPPRPAPPGVDLMSALWVGGRCDQEQVLNNGRHFYVMTRRGHAVRPDGSERCDYNIVDDDGERFRGWVALGARHGRRVPLEIGVIDGVTRRLALVAVTMPAARDAAEPPWSAAMAARAVTPAAP